MTLSSNLSCSAAKMTSDSAKERYIHTQLIYSYCDWHFHRRGFLNNDISFFFFFVHFVHRVVQCISYKALTLVCPFPIMYFLFLLLLSFLSSFFSLLLRPSSRKQQTRIPRFFFSCSFFSRFCVGCMNIAFAFRLYGRLAWLLVLCVTLVSVGTSDE